MDIINRIPTDLRNMVTDYRRGDFAYWKRKWWQIMWDLMEKAEMEFADAETEERHPWWKKYLEFVRWKRVYAPAIERIYGRINGWSVHPNSDGFGNYGVDVEVHCGWDTVRITRNWRPPHEEIVWRYEGDAWEQFPMDTDERE